MARFPQQSGGGGGSIIQVESTDASVTVTNGSGPIVNLTGAGGGGAVTSVFGRTGAIVAQTGDYTAAQVGALATTGGTMSGPIAMGSSKITNLANGTVATDAAAFGQIPTTLPPSGAAGGDLVGTYPNPTVNPIPTLNFETAVRAAASVSQLTAPASPLPMNSQQITGLADGLTATSAATVQQIPSASVFTSSTTFTPAVSGNYIVELLGGGGGGGGGGSPTNASGTLQVGGAGGGQGEYRKVVLALVSGTTYTVTVGAATGNAAGGAGNGSHPGTAGSTGGLSSISGTGILTVGAAGGGGGAGGPGNTAAPTNGVIGGGYGGGNGGVSQNLAGFQISGGVGGVGGSIGGAILWPGGAGVGTGFGGGGPGATATATLGGNGGAVPSLASGGGGAIGSGNTGTSAGAAGANATALTPGAGGGGGGGGAGTATSGAGGNGGTGAPGQVVITGPFGPTN